MTSQAPAQFPDPARLHASEKGWLELRFRMAASSADGVRAVTLEPDWAGASRHFSRDAGWRRIPLRTSKLLFDSVSNSSPSQLAAAGEIRAGQYDRVLVSTPLVEVEFESGARSPVVSHIEPIARGFDIEPGEVVVIEIDLILREAASNPMNQPEIFVMDARLAALPRAGGARLLRIQGIPSAHLGTSE